MAQQLLTTFAAPIIAQENNASAAASKYQVATYNVSQDTFLYDHVKVSLFVVGCWLRVQIFTQQPETSHVMPQTVMQTVKRIVLVLSLLVACCGVSFAGLAICFKSHISLLAKMPQDFQSCDTMLSKSRSFTSPA